MAKKALEGIRVIEHGMYWTVPHACQIMANMGAEVIKVESIQYYDPVRMYLNPRALGMIEGTQWAYREQGEHPWNRSNYYNDGNLGKLSLTLDLTGPKGKELYKKLVQKSDVVLANMSAGVMDSWGLSYDVLKEVNPGIIMVLAPAYGVEGPESDYVAFGANQWQASGFASITGYPDLGPMQASINYGDPGAGLPIVGFVMAALLHRERTGKGQFIDVSQAETMGSYIGEMMLDYAFNGRIAGLTANRHPYLAPQGVYPCRGEEEWIAITIGSEEEWQAFCNAMKNPEWTKEERFSDNASRMKNHDELDRLIGEWTGGWVREEIMYILERLGIAAAVVTRLPEVLGNPQLHARGFHRWVTHPETGTLPHPNITSWKMSKTQGEPGGPSPCLGEHNEHVLCDILGIPKEELAILEEEKYIGTEPLPGADGIGPKWSREA